MVLGRSRQSKPSGAQQQAPAEPDPELESYLAALNPEESTETTGTGRRFGNSQVHQLRLPLMANEQLKELAVRQGTSPAALAREWVLERLQAATAQPAPQQQHARAPQSAPEWPTSEPSVGADPYAAYGHGGAQPGRPYPPTESDSEITTPHGRQQPAGQQYRR